jgi:hypothetical protein
MGFSEMYVKWVDKYVALIDSAMGKSQLKPLAPFLMSAKMQLLASKVRT